MRHLAADEIITDLTHYERVREDERRRVIALKKKRRVQLGDQASLLFENRETVRFQVQEMIRIERIISPSRIQAELEVYNALLPAEGEISATLMVELGLEGPGSSDEARRRLTGIENHLSLAIGARRIAAVHAGDESSQGRSFEALHYVRFRVDDEAKRLLLSGQSEVTVEIDGPTYRASARLSDETIREIVADLT